MTGKAIYNGPNVFCPVSTSSPFATGGDNQSELRAYKLGKQKCSFNQVELIINDIGNGRITAMRISHAIETPVGLEVDEVLRESCLKFNVGFINSKRIYLYVYLVYATPHRSSQLGNQVPPAYHWIPVTRENCRKGCKGPVIRGLQRFGRMPRRKAEVSNDEDSWKQPHHLYIAIDEASGHHNTSSFRLLLAAYDEKKELLGTTVSNSIRVFANNDAPLGPACFNIHFNIKGGWGTSTSEFPIGNSTVRSYDKFVISRPPLQEILRNSTTHDMAKHVEASTSQQYPLLDPQLDLNKPTLDHQKGDGFTISAQEATCTHIFTDENVDVNPKFFAPRRKRGFRPFREHSSNESAPDFGPLSHCFPTTSTDHDQSRAQIDPESEQPLSHPHSEIPDQSSDEAVAVDVLRNWLIAASSSFGHASDGKKN
ncbi:hypothetical protein R1flu_029035 [Riccia fluitans]|uniref:Uncharacterized protein n=1 Tax=Riccia fluitans TaxID=41844 RepID=A0ABD1XND3_9MARC